jgi:Tol biopolymer transport system component
MGDTIQLWRADPNGTNPMKLADKVFSADCSPDGKWVLFASGKSLYRISAEGGSATEIGLPSPTSTYGAISPDGKWVAYIYTEEKPTKMNRIAVAPAEGGKPQQVFTMPGDTEGLRWAPDGRGVEYLLTRKGATNVWEQMLAGGEPHQVTNFTSGRIVDFSWTRDGKTLLLAKGDLTRDVVMISNLR